MQRCLRRREGFLVEEAFIFFESLCIFALENQGHWLSWLERCVRIAEVAGSSPACSTEHWSGFVRLQTNP